MTPGQLCCYCPSAAVSRVQAGGHDDDELRRVTACQAHLSLARWWCSAAGPVVVDPLPGGWVQLALDDALSAVPR